MTQHERRGGVETGSGRALFQAGVACLVVAGCTADPPPALITLVDAQRLVIQDSNLLPDSAKAAMRTYMSRRDDAVFRAEPNPDMEKIVGPDRGVTAILNENALPEAGRTTSVTIDVPGTGPRAFRISRVLTENERATYTGQARGEPIAVLIVRDSVAGGRITTPEGTYNFRALRYGLIGIAPLERGGTLPELHLLRQNDAVSSESADCDEHDHAPQLAHHEEEC